MQHAHASFCVTTNEDHNLVHACRLWAVLLQGTLVRPLRQARQQANHELIHVFVAISSAASGNNMSLTALVVSQSCRVNAALLQTPNKAFVCSNISADVWRKASTRTCDDTSDRGSKGSNRELLSLRTKLHPCSNYARI